MLRSLQRSTPFRLMAALGGTFLVFLVLAGIAAFGLIRAELDARMQRQLEQTFAVIAQSYGEDDITDLTDLVRSNSAANASDERVFLLRDAAGTALAGNIVTAPQTDGWSAVPPEALGLPAADAQYQIFSGPIGPNRLTVGASFAETGAIGTIVLNSLGLAAALFVMLLVVVGILIAARGQRRMDRIADTMALVGKGELSARIPLRGNHDDLDELSIQINQALDRLAGLVEGMRQVSVDIAHDLKTPLNRLSFTVQQAIDNEEAGRPLAPLLQQVQDEARQINTTFEALLRIAQIESGARRARFKPLSLGPILENLFEAYEDVAFEQGQSLHLALEPLPAIVGDRDLLTQMIANLIEKRHPPLPARHRHYPVGRPHQRTGLHRQRGRYRNGHSPG